MGMPFPVSETEMTISLTEEPPSVGREPLAGEAANAVARFSFSLLTSAFSLLSSHGNHPAVCKLNRIGQEINDHLLNPCLVGVRLADVVHVLS